MSEAETAATGRPVEVEDPRSSMAYRVAELKKSLAEHQRALIEVRTRLELERDAAVLRVALAEAQVALVEARLSIQLEGVRAALAAERGARERAEASLVAERQRLADLTLSIASVPWWAPWRRRPMVEALRLAAEPA